MHQGDSTSEVCTIVFTSLFKSWIINMSELRCFFFFLFPLLVCEMKQVCLDLRALLIPGMEILIFPQNTLKFGLNLDGCEFSLCWASVRNEKVMRRMQ